MNIRPRGQLFKKMLSKVFGGTAENGNGRSGETILRPDELERIGTDVYYAELFEASDRRTWWVERMES